MEQGFSLSELSKYIGYSPYHLSREYKKQTGRTLMDYVMETKITAAAKKIAEGSPFLKQRLILGLKHIRALPEPFLSESVVRLKTTIGIAFTAKKGTKE